MEIALGISGTSSRELFLSKVQHSCHWSSMHRNRTAKTLYARTGDVPRERYRFPTLGTSVWACSKECKEATKMYLTQNKGFCEVPVLYYFDSAYVFVNSRTVRLPELWRSVLLLTKTGCHPVKMYGEHLWSFSIAGKGGNIWGSASILYSDRRSLAVAAFR